jgi:hypothetical protein
MRATPAIRQIRMGFWSKGGGQETNRMRLLAVRPREHLGGAGLDRACAR